MKSKDQQLLEEAYNGITGKAKFMYDLFSAVKTKNLKQLEQLAKDVQEDSLLKPLSFNIARKMLKDPNASEESTALGAKFLEFLRAAKGEADELSAQRNAERAIAKQQKQI